MADNDIKVVIDLTETEEDVDWIRAGRLKARCEAGDQNACNQLRDMGLTRMYPHDELDTSKE